MNTPGYTRIHKKHVHVFSRIHTSGYTQDTAKYNPPLTTPNPPGTCTEYIYIQVRYSYRNRSLKIDWGKANGDRFSGCGGVPFT